MGPAGRVCRAVFERGSHIREEKGLCLSTFEDKRDATVCSCAYPTVESRGAGACTRAIDMAVDCFLERPAITDVAMNMITKMMYEDVQAMQDGDKVFLCSYAGIYIFKGKARIHPLGYSAAMFYELGELKRTWSGDGIPVGSASRQPVEWTEPFELTEDSRIILICAGEDGITEEAVLHLKESGAEDTEAVRSYFDGKHCSYVNLYLPKRERRGFLR